VPEFLSPDEILDIHRSLMKRIGGDARVRDIELLESAALAPQETRFGELVHKTMRAQAAMYWLSIGLNQPFYEGNEKTGLVVCEIFLQINNFELDLQPKEIADIIGSISKRIINTRDKLMHRIRIRAT
jgi:death-on-curing protein